jgi:hypothetical protein
MRHRARDSRYDKDGAISRQHGNTLISTLRETYGADFASGFDGDEKLDYTLERLDQESLSHLGACCRLEPR